MASGITEREVSQLLHFAAFSAAQKVGVPEAEWEPVGKLTLLVHSANPGLGAALDAFTKAYIEWFNFTEKVEAEGKSGKLSVLENQQLFDAMSLRDSTRNAFIHALKGRA